MRQGSTWHRWTRNCSWVPCLAPLRSQEVCHIGPHRESRKTPCRSCPPNRTCWSRQSAHPYSSVGFASKCMRHPGEGTIHQHTAIWADHRRRTARPVRDCAAIASLVAPCHSGEIQVRTARDCNHHQSCDPQHAMSSAEAAQAMPKEIQLSLGPDAGPNDDLERGSQYRTAPKLGKIGTGCAESASTQTRNAQQTWNKTGQDWQRDRPSSSQDWRHDWQWEGDRNRTLKGSSASNTARGSQQAGPDDESWGAGRARIRPPPQPKRKVVEKWALREKLHQANQEGAADLLRDFLGRGDFKKFHTSFHTQTDEDCEQEKATHAPYLFDVRPRPLQHSCMVALSKRLTVCLRHDKGEFGLEWTPQAMTPLEKVLSLRIMQERGAKLEEVLAVVYHSDKKRFRLGVIQGTLYIGACQGRSMEVEEDHVYTSVEPSEVPPIIHATCYDFYASILKTGIKPGGGNPRTRGHIHCLRDHVSQHRFFPPGVEIILHLEHAAHTVRWYLTDNGYFVTPDTIPAAAITAVTIIASGQRVSFKDHPPPAASIAMAMACAPSGSRAYMTSLPGEGMAPQCPVTSPSGYPPQDCHHRSQMATGGHLHRTPETQ